MININLDNYSSSEFINACIRFNVYSTSCGYNTDNISINIGHLIKHETDVYLIPYVEHFLVTGIWSDTLCSSIRCFMEFHIGIQTDISASNRFIRESTNKSN